MRSACKRLRSSIARSTEASPAAPRTCLASGRGSAWRRDDGGGTWTGSASPLPTKAAIADPSNPLRRYGITGFGTSALLVSADAGSTWLPAAQDGPPYGEGLV